MQINVIGLGKMGFGIAKNLSRKGYSVVGYDIDLNCRQKAEQEKLVVVEDIAKMASWQKKQSLILLSIPAGELIDEMLQIISTHFRVGDIVVDCGNSNYKETVKRYQFMKQKGLHYLDCGVSGGPGGALSGACTMIGGDEEVYRQVKEVFDAMSLAQGSLYIGKSGSGHFVKMVHNGIEYGMMQAIAEGYEIMYESEYEIDLARVSQMYNNGSVIRSWLIELMGTVLSEDPKLEALKGVMQSSGEAKWTVETALELEVPAPVITLSLMMRNRSLKEDTYSGRVVAALRNQFGGHSVVRDQK